MGVQFGDANKKNDQSPEVKQVRTLLMEKGFLTDEEITSISSIYDSQAQRTVQVFQAQNLDQHGQLLVVDGLVGGVTGWSLHHPKLGSQLPSAVDYLQMPPEEVQGSRRGRAALSTAIGELKANAGEIGGNNRGPFVKKYLNGMVSEANSWCAGFVSY